jgi:hypothetical protein
MGFCTAIARMPTPGMDGLRIAYCLDGCLKVKNGAIGALADTVTGSDM